jgi:hypothetical protein
MRERAKAQGNLEQDLTVQNYGLKQQGVQNFSNFVNNLESNEFQRRTAASGALAGTQQAQSDAFKKAQQFNIDQDTQRSIQNQQNILGGAAIQSGLASNAYAQNIAAQNQAATLALAKEEARLAGRGMDIYGRSSEKMYGK